jgi:hypothetical protein|tara:strand:+ start:4152 stop:4406 length:255 start_codon:yes stop_codon:yes gene_type:complete
MKKLIVIFITTLFCLTSSFAIGETLSLSDLEKRSGTTYKKLTDVPFTGTLVVEDEHGLWESYYENGKLSSKGTWKHDEYIPFNY